MKKILGTAEDYRRLYGQRGADPRPSDATAARDGRRRRVPRIARRSASRSAKKPATEEEAVGASKSNEPHRLTPRACPS